jgi:hypothetical protein
VLAVPVIEVKPAVEWESEHAVLHHPPDLIKS